MTNLDIIFICRLLKAVKNSTEPCRGTLDPVCPLVYTLLAFSPEQDRKLFTESAGPRAKGVAPLLDAELSQFPM